MKFCLEFWSITLRGLRSTGSHLTSMAESHPDLSTKIHQIETTVNFARKNHLLNWYIGGLNFQIEHHLFPRISHVHYPALSEIVENTCREFGIGYFAQPSLLSSLKSHYLFLYKMGRPA